MFFTFIFYTFLTGFLVKSYELTNFKNINVNRKLEIKYKQVNYVKGITLGLFSPYTLYIIYSILYNNVIPNYVPVFGSLYAALDMSSTIYNYSNNHISTNIHHVCVQLLFLNCIIYNWNINTLCCPIILYASFSALSFLVNYRLAIRGTDDKYEYIINKICLYCYSFFSVINWFIQIYIIFFVKDLNYYYYIEKPLYISTIILVVMDDLYLIKYLKQNN